MIDNRLWWWFWLVEHWDGHIQPIDRRCWHEHKTDESSFCHVRNSITSVVRMCFYFNKEVILSCSVIDISLPWASWLVETSSLGSRMVVISILSLKFMLPRFESQVKHNYFWGNILCFLSHGKQFVTTQHIGHYIHRTMVHLITDRFPIIPIFLFYRWAPIELVYHLKISLF